MSVSDLDHLGRYLGALRHTILTSGVELTTLGGICRAGKLALECHRIALLMRVRDRNCGEQSLGVGVLCIGADLLLGASLNDVAKVHNGDLIGDILNNGEVVGNEHIGHTLFSLELLEKVDDLCLDRNVERRNGLIADNELGLDRKRTRDAYSLTLTAGELVRISVVMMGLKAASCHNASYVFGNFGIGNDLMDLNCLAYDRADRHSGRKRRIGILEYELKLGSEGTKVLLFDGSELVGVNVAVSSLE